LRLHYPVNVCRGLAGSEGGVLVRSIQGSVPRVVLVVAARSRTSYYPRLYYLGTLVDSKRVTHYVFSAMYLLIKRYREFELGLQQALGVVGPYLLFAGY
jgi:hypothetical protein